MGTYAVFADVAARRDESIPDSLTGWVDALIEEAEADLVSKVPNVAARVALDPTDSNYLNPALVRVVVVRAVLRTVNNPRGYVSEGDGTYTYQRGAAAGGGDVMLSAADLALLGVRASRPRVGTIGMGTFIPVVES